MITKCNITKPPTPWAKEIIYRPSGNECTNTPWGCQLPKIWEDIQSGEWDHIEQVKWCLIFEGTEGKPEDPLQVSIEYGNIESDKITANRKNNKWNCTKVYNCSTKDAEVQRIYPVAKLLRLGCACRNLTTYLNDTWSYLTNNDTWTSIDCLKNRVESLGQTVWVSSSGEWHTHAPLTGPIREWTLGMLTLCPLWRKEPLHPHPWLRVKRDSEWKRPSSGVQIGWTLESIFLPGVSALENKIAIYNLTYQTESLANATQKGLQDLNTQLQATSKMVLQHRLALDFMLVKAHGLCGYLDLSSDTCCIHIPNVTWDLNKQINKIRQVAQQSRGIREDLEGNWINTILGKLEFSLSGWLASMLQNVIVICIIIGIVCVMLVCLKNVIMAIMHRMWASLTSNRYEGYELLQKNLQRA